jgi:hypothetical protein
MCKRHRAVALVEAETEPAAGRERNKELGPEVTYAT